MKIYKGIPDLSLSMVTETSTWTRTWLEKVWAGSSRPSQPSFRASAVTRNAGTSLSRPMTLLIR